MIGQITEVILHIVDENGNNKYVKYSDFKDGSIEMAKHFEISQNFLKDWQTDINIKIEDCKNIKFIK